MTTIRIADVFIRDFHEFVLYELAASDVYPIRPRNYGPKPYPEDTTQAPRYYVSWNESDAGLNGVPSLTLWCLRTDRRVTVGEPEGWESWWDQEEECIEPADVIRHVVDILYRDVIMGADTHVEKLLTPALCEFKSMFTHLLCGLVAITKPPVNFSRQTSSGGGNNVRFYRR